MLGLFGVADGTRTHDDQNHNLGLYQLSYSHRRALQYNPPSAEPGPSRRGEPSQPLSKDRPAADQREPRNKSQVVALFSPSLKTQAAIMVGMSVPPNRRNHYRVLHVQPEAPLEVIKASYRTLMMRMKLHPDLGGNHETAAAVNEAYAVLSDPQRRADYDRQLRLKSRPELMRRDAGGSPATRPAGVAHPTPNGGTGPLSAAVANLYSRTVANPLPSAIRISCEFCFSTNVMNRATGSLCTRCGAPLTPVRQVVMPNFGSLGHNRRQSVRRPRQADAVAYWGMPPQRHRVMWRDLSAGGLSIWASKAATIGQRIQLMDPEIHTVAEVVASEARDRETWLIRARLLTLRTTGQAGLFCSAQA